MSASKGFGNTLRSSRLASVAKPVNASYADNVAPKFQVIKTTPSSLYRKDFGLKRCMPAGSKTPYITVQSLDTMYGMTSYEFGSSFHFKYKRFQELGVSLCSGNSNKAHDSLFAQPANNNIHGLTRAEALDLLQKSPERRSEFLKFSKLNTKDDKQQRKSASELINTFYGLSENTNVLGSLRKNHKGNTGLSFLLHGSIKNTPKGPVLYRPVPGRQISAPRANNTKNLAAIGGFVSNYNGSAGDSFYVSSAFVDSRNSIQLSVKPTKDSLTSSNPTSTIQSLSREEHSPTRLSNLSQVTEKKA
ncbi:mitochondrial 37S ribosomal protein bS1m [Magnusiomyces paraingens]|uniref:Uncharacterized protein n=1 Tax=Magnusiomyces paraingens TaxID=2606893 RepID=A0A5E8C1W9_9ASCO|nr:uncharacterized protein SAPINGB_P005843 [Saprochaete ingens]VVT57734.1 unnamed protein product [Saprochaete ingens]